MASAAGKKVCIFCDKTVDDRDATKISTANHPLFPRQAVTIKEVLIQLLSMEKAFAHPPAGIRLDELIGDDEEICGACLERVATSRLQQLTKETTAAVLRFAMRDG